MANYCYRCKDTEGELIDGFCCQCYSIEQERRFRAVLGDSLMDEWLREAENDSRPPSASKTGNSEQGKE